MFEHPEGQPHPRPPKNLRELKDLNYTEGFWKEFCRNKSSKTEKHSSKQ